MPLPSCICVVGRPPFDRLNDIFCALSQIQGGGCTTPVLLFASQDVDTLTLTFNVAVTGFGVGANGFDLTVDGSPAQLDYLSGNGTTTIEIFSDVEAAFGDEIILNYIPGDIANGECPLEAIVDFEVYNSTGGGLFTADNTFITADSTVRSADGGFTTPLSPAWFDSIDPGSTDTSEATETTFSIFSKVVPTINGNATKLRVYEAAILTASPVGVKIALFDFVTGALLGSGVTSVSTGSPPDDGWIELTMAVPVPVSSGTTYLVGWEAASNPAFFMRYLNGAPLGSSYVNFASSYAAFPQDPQVGLAAFTRNYAAGMYVEP